MESSEIKIGILTSSRADYGIYLPLLTALKSDDSYQVELICFGTHLSKFHGYTLDDIDQVGYDKVHTIENILTNDSPSAISTSFGLTALQFADFWKTNHFDLVFCLGDRFEMASAVFAGLPYGVQFAHLHGGETTLGAIDNIYRHSISLASKFHFVSTEKSKKRILELIPDSNNVRTVGALSLDNVKNINLLSKEEFYTNWNIDLNLDTILFTIHPETVDFEGNQAFSEQVLQALLVLVKEKQIVITMPNADTSGLIYREKFEELAKIYPQNIKLIENFGTQGYFTCMKYSKLVVGNSSSGIIEAASFGKYVINIGDRQKGREASENVVNVSFNKDSIINAINKYFAVEFQGRNVYDHGGSTREILNFLKESYGRF